MTIEPGRNEQRGFALLIVLWIFMVLFVLGAEFAVGMRQNAQATVTIGRAIGLIGQRRDFSAHGIAAQQNPAVIHALGVLERGRNQIDLVS